MLASLLSLIVAHQGVRPAFDSWLHVRVDAPTPEVLRKLTESDFDVMDCIPHLGSDDVAIRRSELIRLVAAGFRYDIVGSMEDPANWGERHAGRGFFAPDDYRFQYFNADQIIAFYENLRATYPAIVSRRSIGTSINGETMWAYGFKSPNGSRTPNNIVIESLIHAREWITGSCTMHVAKKLCELYSDTTTNRALTNQAVWIIPITNPDGYRYTWTNNRMWRKNRRLVTGSTYGVDLNRNFAKGWGNNDGSSGSASSETYRGSSAFSEPETRAVRDFVASLGRVGGFIDYHSYSQLILEPWSYSTAAPPDASTFIALGNAMKSQMDGFGATYTAGQTSIILYIASGTSSDYFYDVRHNLALAIELRDTGTNGFVLPADQIFPSQEEVWAGFQRYMTAVGS